MRTCLRLPLLLMIVMVFSGQLATVCQAAVDRPNVLFIICDDLNCDLGCYGHPQVQSPHIDSLAQRGVRFDGAYCQYPLCGPSRASFMTGLYPDQTNVRRNPVFVRERLPNVVTMSQLFRYSGYKSARIGKIYHYGVPKNIGSSGHDDPESWDYAINPRGRDREEHNLIFSVKPGEFGGYMSWLAADGTDEEQTDGIAATEAVRLINQFTNRDEPFFLAVGLYRPHTPYVAPRKYFDMYSADDMVVPDVPPGYLQTLPSLAQKTLRKKKEHYTISKEKAREAKQAYYASISFADAQIGRILEGLEQAGATDNTIIVFCSDHGYHLGEHGHWLKTALFENATRVPLIIAGPGVSAAGQTTQSLAELTDLYPTVAELCGLRAPGFVSGTSLTPVLSDTDATPRTSALSQLKQNYSIRTADFRYTEWGEDGSGGAELYDRRIDPQEMVNLAGSDQYADQQRKLSKLLRSRVADSRRAPAGLKQVADPIPPKS